MLNSTKYLYKLTFIKCSYEHPPVVFFSRIKQPAEEIGRNTFIHKFPFYTGLSSPLHSLERAAESSQGYFIR